MQWLTNTVSESESESEGESETGREELPKNNLLVTTATFLFSLLVARVHLSSSL